MFISIGDNIFCIFRINQKFQNMCCIVYCFDCMVGQHVLFLVIFLMLTVQWCSCYWCYVQIQFFITFSHFDLYWEESVMLFSSNGTKFRCFFLFVSFQRNSWFLPVYETKQKESKFVGRLLYIHKSCIEHRGFVVMIKIQEECQNPGSWSNISLKNSLAEMSSIWNWFEQISDMTSLISDIIIISSVCAS